jgi:alanine racemase
MMAPALSRPSRIHIDLKALVHNLGLARKAAGKAQVMAVVKADAYGHGAAPVSRALERAGVGLFGVATLEEALELRKAGIQGRLLLLGPAESASIAEAAKARVELSFWNAAYLHDAQRLLARHRGLPALGAHIKVDTGMARLGFSPNEVPAVLEGFAQGLWPRLQLRSGFTHLSGADARLDATSPGQLNAFLRLPWPKDLALHAGASAAALRLPKSRLSYVRPGILLYGAADPALAPLAGKQKPVLSLSTQVVSLRRLAKGQGVSYGSTHVTRRPTLVATLALGYADGLPRALSNQGQVLIQGRRCAILGRICMDLCMVDATQAPGVKVGDTAWVLGHQGKERLGVAAMALQCQTIAYEILCGFSSRLPRVYEG